MDTAAKTLRGVRVLRPDIVLPVTGCVLPLAVAGPQLLTGTGVNMLLALYAYTCPKKNAWVMCALPGLGAVSNGLLFGTFTPYLVYFLPFIWLGNYLFITSIRTLHTKHPVIAIGVPAAGKALLLFVVSAIFVRFTLVPSVFLMAMGGVQLVTALTGGSAAYGILRAAKSHV